MVVREEHQQIKTLLRDTITLLLKNGLAFKAKFSVEALIGVTLDDDQVLLLSINENVKVKTSEAGEDALGDTEDRDSSSERVPERLTPQVKKERTESRKRGRPQQWHSPDRGEDVGVSADSNEADELDCSNNVQRNRTRHVDDDGIHGAPPTKRPSMTPTQHESDTGDTDGGDTKGSIVIKHEVVDLDSWQSEYMDDDLSEQGSEIERIPGAGTTLAEWQDVSQQSDSANFAGLVGEQGLGADQQTMGLARGLLESSRGRGNSDYSGHSVSATEVSQYHVVCPICRMTIVRSWLRGHMAKHGGSYRYRCDTCGKGFTAKNSLRDHERGHTGERIHCQECAASFVSESGFRVHMKKAHPWVFVTPQSYIPADAITADQAHGGRPSAGSGDDPGEDYLPVDSGAPPDGQ